MDRVISPTLKFVKLGYAAAAACVVACAIVWLVWLPESFWLPLLALLLLLWPAAKHFRRTFTRMTITGDKLRYEAGLLAKSTRTVQLSKVQDVRVDQRLGQRIMGVGDLSIETAGETSRLTVVNIDAPQEVADAIIEASQTAQGRGSGA